MKTFHEKLQAAANSINFELHNAQFTVALSRHGNSLEFKEVILPSEALERMYSQIQPNDPDYYLKRVIIECANREISTVNYTTHYMPRLDIVFNTMRQTVIEKLLAVYRQNKRSSIKRNTVVFFQDIDAAQGDKYAYAIMHLYAHLMRVNPSDHEFMQLAIYVRGILSHNKIRGRK